jgi:long-chain acyl-CoA synthetase
VNLAAIVDDHPDDAVALISRGEPTTYGRLREQAGHLRGGLASLGLEPDDRVAILCANNWYFVVSYLAVTGAGMVAVPLNPLSPAPEIEQQLAAIGARAVIVGPSARPTVQQLDRSQVPTLEHVIVAPGVEIDGALDLDELMANEPAPLVERGDDALAVLIFTSGTAGSPKAAMLTHGNLRSNFDQGEGPVERSDDVVFGVVPLFHILGLNGVLGLALFTGASIVLIERFDPASALESIQTHGVTIVAGPPTLWSAWAALPDADPTAMASVRLAISGAAKLPQDVAETIEARFGVHIWEGYGLTETAPVVATSVGTDAPFGSIGVPVRGVDVRLVDAQGGDVPIGDAGEIWVRGPNVFQGYWHDASATATALTDDGWLRTGDLAVVDDDGFLYLVDRAKDLVIVSGFNVYPAEVEGVLAEHPGVASCAVVGVPHPHTGEAVKAYVVASAGQAVDEDDLIVWCQGRIARYKCPSKVMFVDDLPQGLAGKVRRRDLRDEPTPTVG